MRLTWVLLVNRLHVLDTCVLSIGILLPTSSSTSDFALWASSDRTSETRLPDRQPAHLRKAGGGRGPFGVPDDLARFRPRAIYSVLYPTRPACVPKSWDIFPRGRRNDRWRGIAAQESPTRRFGQSWRHRRWRPKGGWTDPIGAFGFRPVCRRVRRRQLPASAAIRE